MFDVEHIFKYHAPNPDQIDRYEVIRAEARTLARVIESACPDSREKALALTNLQQAVMWANASIAITEAK